jgi:ribosomal protein S18 acetylase RimI-like enzyme
MSDHDSRLPPRERSRDPDAEVNFRPLAESDLGRIFSEPSREYGIEWLARQERGEIYVAVAEVDGEPLGRAGLDLVRKSDEGIACLWAAHVEPDHQSRGMGSQLLRHLERVALEHGFTSIELSVAKENTRAQALYERVGYKVRGEAVERWTQRHGLNLVEIVEDCWVMRKQLAP